MAIWRSHGSAHGRRSRGARAVGVCLLACTAIAAPALTTGANAAHTRRIATAQDLWITPADYTHPDAMYALEVQVLGKDHALEHLGERNMAARLVAEGKIVIQGTTPPPSGPANQVGQWTAPFTPPNSSAQAIGVHAILFNTGKVLLFGGYFDTNDQTLATDAFLYNPVDGSAVEVDPPHNTFCAGEVLLQDGSLLVVGGRGGNTHPTPGTPYVLRFDPVSETWQEQPQTTLGRYYPTTTELPDGRVLITTGNMTTGQVNRTVEVFTPGVGSAQGSLQTVMNNVVLDLYPKQYVMPNGQVLIIQHNLTSLLDTTAWKLTKLPNLSISRKNNPSSALLPAAPGAPETKVFITGGAQSQRGDTTATSEIFDDDNPTAGWKPAASMPNPRTHMNVIYLPDGTIAGIGGNSFDRFGTPQYAALNYNPTLDSWTTWASQTLRRAYHSTALLLPDGRILSAGDTGPGGGGTRLEIFSPPYLFQGPRPVVTSVSGSQFDYAGNIDITTDSPVSRVVLIHPTAVTHANDMSGRFVELVKTVNSDGSVTASMPANANLAQPGYWMMFVLNSANVPSVATWVHLGPMNYGG
ncbi:MAG TPA: galactose oxidase-like domain-containing protein [Jatrophihabitantaceae bacterium]|nr:galactose oxidase-like domain-containing protein [Jatrophihabitantaceae bacterium]